MNQQQMNRRVLYVILRVLLYLFLHPIEFGRVIYFSTRWVINGGDAADTDYYNVTRFQAIWKLQKALNRRIGARYIYINRNKVKLEPESIKRLRKWAKRFAKRNAYFHQDTVEYLKKVKYLDPDILDQLWKGDRPLFRYEDIHITDAGEVYVECEEPYAGLWEVQLLAWITHELQRVHGEKMQNLYWMVRTWDKVVALKKAGLPVSEFGGRRRAGYFVQLVVLLIIKASGSLRGPNDRGGFLGTSNVHFAQMLNLVLMGTMNHATIMLFGGLFGYHKANRFGAKWWRKVFHQAVGYWLSDSNTTERFLIEVDKDDLLAATGLRQDSHDPFEFIDKVIAHYRSIGLIDEQISKISIVFSDSLNVEKALEIAAYAAKKGIGSSFGIGTFLTNDVDGITPSNVVFKILEVFLMDDPTNRRACVKLSDVPAEPGKPGKVSGDLKVAEQIRLYHRTGKITWLEPLLTDADFEHALELA